MATDIELFSISGGGVLEPKADWTEAASKHFKAALLAKKKSLSAVSVELSEKDADELAEINTLHAIRLEPASFGGQKSFRFEYALTRKVDNVQLSGLGYGAVAKNELFAIVYMAPRLTFFARHKDRVEQIAKSARIKE